MANTSDKKTVYESQESLYRKAVQKMEADELIVQFAYKIDNYQLAAAMFEEVGDYLDAPALARKCRELAEKAREEEKEAKYQMAVKRVETAVLPDEWKKLSDVLLSLKGYKEADRLQERCRQELDRMDRKSRGHRIVFAAVAAAVVALFVLGMTTGFFRYILGIGYMKAGMYSQAEAAFEAVAGFMNSDAYARENKYMRLLDAKVGSEVEYGAYHWKVIRKDGSVLTMITAAVGETHDFFQAPFNDEPGDVTWESSSLRRWLNTEILETKFSEEERAHMVPIVSRVSKNQEYGTAYTEKTEDYLSILSAQEAENNMDQLKSLALDYWLRTPGASGDTVAYITAGHEIRLYGYPANAQDMAVRAIIKVDCEGL